MNGNRAEIKDYKDLEVWQLGKQLAKEAYRITKDFPKEELYGMTSQIRRAAISIPSNIAEGYGRKRTGDYARFLGIALGSACELETQILIADELGFMKSVDAKEYMENILRERQMLIRLIQKIEAFQS